MALSRADSKAADVAKLLTLNKLRITQSSHAEYGVATPNQNPNPTWP